MLVWNLHVKIVTVLIEMPAEISSSSRSAASVAASVVLAGWPPDALRDPFEPSPAVTRLPGLPEHAFAGLAAINKKHIKQRKHPKTINNKKKSQA